VNLFVAANGLALPELVGTLNIVCGALLGASFYVLLDAQPFLVNRSFDPKYNAVYATRVITGFIAGVILAVGLGAYLSKSLEQGSEAAITPAILAIIGGYAAQAVQKVLERIVEIILAAVRGDASGEVRAKATAALATRNAEVKTLLTDYERETDPAKKKLLMDQIQAALRSTSLG
jgi:uncharacterized membrane protein YczE